MVIQKLFKDNLINIIKNIIKMKYKLNIMCDDWKTKFFEVYFDEDSTTAEINAVLDIKNNNIPQYLYKYTDTEHVDDLLKKGLFTFLKLKI